MSYVNQNVNRYYANLAYKQSPDYEREMFERGLQQQEQSRRQFDSETARQGQERKYGVLSGLLGKSGGMSGGGMGGYGGFGGGFGHSVGNDGKVARF